jgi:hypothetical protein
MGNAKYAGNEANTLRNKSSGGEAGNFGVKAGGRTGTKSCAARMGRLDMPNCCGELWNMANYGIMKYQKAPVGRDDCVIRRILWLMQR